MGGLDILIVIIVIALALNLGFVYGSQVVERASDEAYWQGWNDAIAACPEGCGSDGGGMGWHGDGYPPRLEPNVTHCNTSGVCSF